jgi:putative endonuclease
MDGVSFVYILASRFRGTIYIGVTSDLMRRIWEHRSGIRSRFPSRYAVYRLVRYEAFGDIELAIRREKQLKRWHRPWKINLIEADNPGWDDLAVALGFERLPEEPRRPRPLGRHPELGSGSSPKTRGAGGGLDPETSSG